MQATPVLSRSPSFARTNLTEFTDRVVEEFTAENERDSEFSFNDNDENENHENQVYEDDDSDFAFVTAGSDQFSSISADEIFYNGQICPIFNRDLLLNGTGCISEKVSIPQKSNRVSLRKLFIEDREIASSGADHLEGITPGTYCVWRPRSKEKSPSELCKKSNSTSSSSKRWKLRDFIHRSNSEGKETFVFLTTTFKKREEKTESTRIDSAKITGVPAVESFPALRYSENRKDKRKSYLPYRQDLVKLFG